MESKKFKLGPEIKLLLLVLLLIAIGVVLIWKGVADNTKVVPEETRQNNQQLLLTPSPVIESGVEREEVQVTRVIDGDTIEVSNGKKVRYIGIDTPETVDPRRPVGCFGKEASEENKKLVEGKTVLLVKDVSEMDKYSRLLRYVYVKQDNGEELFVNDYLVREGYAKVSTYPPDVKFTTQFLEAEREAREGKRGLWSKC